MHVRQVDSTPGRDLESRRGWLGKKLVAEDGPSGGNGEAGPPDFSERGDSGRRAGRGERLVLGATTVGLVRSRKGVGDVAVAEERDVLGRAPADAHVPDAG